VTLVGGPSREAALDALVDAARGIGEQVEQEAVERLLARIAVHPYRDALTVALVELGSRALLSRLRRAAS